MCWKIFVLKMKSVLSCLNGGQIRAVKGGVALKGSLHLCCYLSHSLPPPPSPTLTPHHHHHLTAGSSRFICL